MRINPLFSLSLPLVSLALLSGASCVLERPDRVPEIVANYKDSRPIAGEKQLKVSVHFRVGHIIIGAAPGDLLYSLDVDYDSGRYEPDLSYDESSHHLDFRLRRDREDSWDNEEIIWNLGDGNSSESSKNRLNLLISPQVVLELDLGAGIGETRINLTGLQTRSLEIESGVSSTFISCESPNQVTCKRLRFKAGVGKFEALQLGNLNFRRLEFEGGVGTSRLEFSGQWRDDANVSVQMGVGKLTIQLPSRLGAEVDCRKKFLSGLHLESFTPRGGLYFSDNYDKTQYHVRFRLRTGIGSIHVNWL